MSEQELAKIRDFIRGGAQRWVGDEVEPVVGIVNSLLAEVERLRAENTELREIAQAVATDSDDGGPYVHGEYDFVVCGFCQYEYNSHAPDCPVRRARALLGETPKE